MFSRLFRSDRSSGSIASSLYGAIVAQARAPGLYAAIGVPDSVDGRFEMVVLHLVLVTRRLEPGGEAARAAGQGVFDLFCRDMDRSLRELGVGDLSVPKRMRQVGEAYFGRTAAYEPCLAAKDPDTLAEVFRRTVFSGADPGGDVRALAAYAVAVTKRLGAQEESAIVAGTPDFPAPEAFATQEPAR